MSNDNKEIGISNWPMLDQVLARNLQDGSYMSSNRQIARQEQTQDNVGHLTIISYEPDLTNPQDVVDRSKSKLRSHGIYGQHASMVTELMSSSKVTEIGNAKDVVVGRVERTLYEKPITIKATGTREQVKSVTAYSPDGGQTYIVIVPSTRDTIRASMYTKKLKHKVNHSKEPVTFDAKGLLRMCRGTVDG